jgi:DNA-binding SARP family transcriptional activator
MSTWLALLEHHPGDADSHSRQAVECQEKTGSSQALAITQLARAMALRLMGDKLAASDYLEKAFGSCRQTKTYQIEFGCHLARAEFSLGDGDEAAALDALRKGMALGRKQGYVNNYFWRPRVMARLCQKCLDAGIEIDYVRGLIRKRNLIPDEPLLETENWPWPIRVFTLGRFGLEIDGTPFSFSGKVRRTPLSLLKALIAFGGKDVAEHTLHDALWPDAEGDAAENAFSTTLHRLRKMLQYEKAVRLSDGKVSLDERYCWVDVQFFNKYLGKVEELWPTPQEKDKAKHVESLMNKIMSLAPGFFLPDETSSWAISLREELKDLLLQLLQRFVRHLMESENTETAVSWCNRALALDPCNEYFYQQLMHLYASKGLRSQVLAAYHRCCGNLAAVYGIQPSDETKNVFRKTKGD